MNKTYQLQTLYSIGEWWHYKITTPNNLVIQGSRKRSACTIQQNISVYIKKMLIRLNAIHGGELDAYQKNNKWVTPRPYPRYAKYGRAKRRSN